MKRLILRFAVAMLTFALGFVIDRILVSRSHEVPIQQPVKVEPAPTTLVDATPAVLASSLPNPSPTPHQIFDFDSAKFDPSGVYYILGSKPKEFHDFEYIAIWTEKVEGNLSGGVYFQNDISDEYDVQTAAFSLITPRRLIFVTSPHAGEEVVYRFDGEFLHRNPASVTNTSKAVLRGTLTKTVNGRKVAERVVSFWIDTEDHC